MQRLRQRFFCGVFQITLGLLFPSLVAAQMAEEMSAETADVSEVGQELEMEEVLPDIQAMPREGVGPRAGSSTVPFGHYIFSLDAGMFDPVGGGSVDPDYPVGPGDEIAVSVWGQVEFTHTLAVDPEGGVNLPRIGRIYVNGLTLGDLQKRVVQKLSRAYPGIREDQGEATTFVNVSLGKIKSVKVFVTGDVRRPGPYIMAANASVMGALYKAGGPTENGSMRQIKLLRHGKQVASMDLYSFILDGDMSQDTRIQNRDVILVPPQGPEVILSGKVHRPHVYELKKCEGLTRLLEIAGGLEVNASWRTQVERIAEGQDYSVIDVDLTQVLTSGKSVPLFDGDRVAVLERSRITFKKVVSVDGFVRNPGRYQLVSDMRVKDLILKSGSLFPETYVGRADIQRTRPDMVRELVSFNLEKALAGDPVHNIGLSPLDRLTVYSIHTFGEQKSVIINGLVRKPGKYELLEGMGLQDLIVMASGLQDIAYKVEAEISRTDPEQATNDRPIQVFRTEISDVYEINSKPEDVFTLQHRDVVFIRPHPDFVEILNVEVKGAVRFPGVYSLKGRSERLTELLQRAGGLREEAYVGGLRFFRSGVGYIAIDVVTALKRPGSVEDPILQADDVIEIPTTPTTVEVIGAVYIPGHVFFRPGKGVSYYLNRVGGPNRNAHIGHIYVVLANGEAVRPSRFLFWKHWPDLNAGSRIVVPFKDQNIGDVKIFKAEEAEPQDDSSRGQ